MKIRYGFVSNSSSSSYVCEICNTAVEVYETPLYELGFCQCDYGHVFCLDHSLDQTAAINDDGCVSVDVCPICKLKLITDRMFVDYTQKRIGVSRDEMLKDIKSRFKTYKELVDYVYE